MKNAQLKILLVALGVIGLIACRANGVTPSVEQPVSKPTARPTATLQVQVQPTQPSTKGGMASYDDPTAPFAIQYPAGWKVREEPESIFFQASDQSATIQVIIYEYPEGAPKTATAKEIFDRFAQTFAQGTGLKLTNQANRPDASVFAEVAFQDPATRNPLQGFVRVVLSKSRRYHFIVLFTSDLDLFARYKPIGMAALDSFRERP